MAFVLNLKEGYKMLKRLVIVSMLMLSFLSAGNKVASKGTYPACMDKDTFSEFVSAAISAGYKDAYRVYASKGCTIIFKGDMLTIIERNFGTAKVLFNTRATGNRTVIMYTVIEAVR